MWIALGIVGGLLMLVGLILCLPISLIIRNDEQGQLQFRVKVLCVTFGGSPSAGSDSTNPIVDYIMDITGFSRTKGTAIRSNVKSGGVGGTLADTVRVVWSALEEVVRLVPQCRLTRLKFTMICTAEDADAAALHYGKCCAVVYPLVAWIHAALPVSERHECVDIRPDFMAPQDEIRYDIQLRMYVFSILKAFLKIVSKETVRSRTHLISAQTHATRRKNHRRKKKHPSKKPA